MATGLDDVVDAGDELVRAGVGLLDGDDGDGEGETVGEVVVGGGVPPGVVDTPGDGEFEVDADGLGDGGGVAGFLPWTGPMIDGPWTCTLPGAISANTAAAATPAKASPPAAAVNARALPLRKNSVRRRSRRSLGRAARCADSELSGALR